MARNDHWHIIRMNQLIGLKILNNNSSRNKRNSVSPVLIAGEHLLIFGEKIRDDVPLSFCHVRDIVLQLPFLYAPVKRICQPLTK